jgi:hypothetical protein
MSISDVHIVCRTISLRGGGATPVCASGGPLYRCIGVTPRSKTISGELAVPDSRVTALPGPVASTQVRTVGDDVLTERRESIRIDFAESLADFGA